MTTRVALGLMEALGPGLLTVSEPLPWFCRSEAVRATCKTVVLTTVVGRAEPFHCTTEFDSNPVPVTVMMAAVPVGTYCGEIEVIAGTGLFTVKEVPEDVPPPGAGLFTEIWLCELPVRSEAGMVALI